MTGRNLIRTLTLVSCIAGCAHRGAPGSVTASPSTGPDVGRGAALFAKNCSVCHVTHGVAGQLGPSLHDERRRSDAQEVRRIIVSPDPPMPELYPGTLTQRDVSDLTAYVETL